MGSNSEPGRAEPKSQAMHMTPAIYPSPVRLQGTSFIQVSDAAEQSESIVGLWQSSSWALARITVRKPGIPTVRN